MSYLKSKQWENGDFFTTVDYYSCDITGDEICESDGWYGNERIHISEKGIEILIEEHIKRLSMYGIGALFIEYLKNKYTNKDKPNRYISKTLKKEVLNKYKHTCIYCGSTKTLEIDHIKPISKGGLNTFNNLQVLCKSCNIKKSNK